MKLYKSILTTISLWIGYLLTAQAEQKDYAELWSNPVVIGASVSDGYHRLEPIGGVESEKLSLEHYLDAAIVVKHGEIKNFGNKFFFMNFKGVSEKQAENAAKLKPSVLLAPDFLFWQMYGRMGDDMTRIEALERGLKLLEPFNCPIVLGNIPDASKAKYKMLAPSQIPSLELIKVANQKIAQWVSARDNVTVLDSASFMRKSHDNEEIKMRHITLRAGETESLLQADFLHPTAYGAKAISLAILEALQLHTSFPDEDVKWSIK